MSDYNKCAICQQPFEGDGEADMSKFAIYGGLPQNTCGYCFTANDYRIKSVEELMVKSFKARFGGDAVKPEGDTP